MTRKDKHSIRRVALFIGAMHAGGAERIIGWLSGSLAREGCDVSLITLDDADCDAYKLDPSVVRIGLGLKGRTSLLLKPFSVANRVMKLRQVLRERQVQQLIAFMPQEAIMAIVACKFSKVQVIISERTTPWKRTIPAIWEVLRQRLYKRADGQVAQNRQVASWMRTSLGCKNVHIIPNPVVQNTAANLPVLRPESFLDPSRKYVLAVGTRPFLKGFDVLIECFATLAASHEGWDLIVLGMNNEVQDNGMGVNHLRDLASARGIADRVIFPGQVGNVQEWYRACDLFALSSRVEGFPNVLIEAMAQGLATVAFDCDTGPSEIIDDLHSGLLIPDGDCGRFSAGLDRLMRDQGLRLRIGKQAKDASKKFSEEVVLAKWLKLVDVA